MSDIGKGDWVISDGSGKVVAGVVAMVCEVETCSGECIYCGPSRFGLCLTLPNSPGFSSWCANHWRPLKRPPEQATTRRSKTKEPA